MASVLFVAATTTIILIIIIIYFIKFLWETVVMDMNSEENIKCRKLSAENTDLDH
jgi:hypothetical protein